MPYYCTVPRCTSMAGKAKNVSFHQFPRDEELARLWNEVLKRGKPYTKYSKVCSLHFRPEDYTITSVGKNKGQWRTLRKDAIPSQNLPSDSPEYAARRSSGSWTRSSVGSAGAAGVPGDPRMQHHVAQAIYMQTMMAMQNASNDGADADCREKEQDVENDDSKDVGENDDETDVSKNDDSNDVHDNDESKDVGENDDKSQVEKNDDRALVGENDDKSLVDENDDKSLVDANDDDSVKDKDYVGDDDDESGDIPSSSDEFILFKDQNDLFKDKEYNNSKREDKKYVKDDDAESGDIPSSSDEFTLFKSHNDSVKVYNNSKIADKIKFEDDNSGDILPSSSAERFLNIEKKEPSLQSESELVLDDMILDILVDDPQAAEEHGRDVLNEITSRLEDISTTGLEEDVRQELLKKYPVPEICLRIGAPTLNPEAKKLLPQIIVFKDQAIESVQEQIATAIACLTDTLADQLHSKDPNKELLKKLMDIGRLLCDVQHKQSMQRRNIVINTLDVKVHEPLTKTKIGANLFGDDLSKVLGDKEKTEEVKSNGENKVGVKRKRRRRRLT